MKITNKGIKFTIDTVDELLTITGEENQVVIVSDENRGGTFIYRSAKSTVNDGGVTFNGWCRQYSGAVNVKWFGAKGDGFTDDTLAIQTAMNASNEVSFPDKLFICGQLHPSHCVLLFNNTRIKTTSTTDAISLSNGVVIIGELDIDLDNVAFSGIRGQTLDDFDSSLSTITIRNSKTGGSSTNGGIILYVVSSVKLGNVIGYNISQVMTGMGVARLVDVANCSKVTFDTIENTDGDITLNIYATTNVKGKKVLATNCSANTTYITNNSRDISIDIILADNPIGVGVGISLSSSFANANVKIGHVSISGSTNGLDTRNGGGYYIGSLQLENSSFASNSVGSGIDGLYISSASIRITDRTDIRAITLSNSSNVHCPSMDIIANSVLGGRAIHLGTGSDKILLKGTFSTLNNQTIARIESDADFPEIAMDFIHIGLIAEPYSYTAISSFDNIMLKGNNKIYTDSMSVVSNNSLSSIILESKKNKVEVESISRISVIGNDFSSPGEKFSIDTYSTSTFGVTYRTKIRDSANNVVGFIKEGASPGMTIVLPTSDSSLPSGSLWNNSGVITIKP